MPEFRSDRELEEYLGRFAPPRAAGTHDATLMAAARLRAEELVDERREARLLWVARALDVFGLPMLSHFVLRLTGRTTPLRVVLI